MKRVDWRARGWTRAADGALRRHDGMYLCEVFEAEDPMRGVGWLVIMRPDHPRIWPAHLVARGNCASVNAALIEAERAVGRSCSLLGR